MKITLVLCTLLSVLILVLSANAAEVGTEAGSTLIVCSEFLNPAVQAELQSHIAALLTTAPAGHRLVVVRGADHATVINLSIPGGSTRERLRNRSVTQAMGLLQRDFRQASQSNATGNAQLGIPNLPATYWSTVAGHGPCRIILLGDPIFDDTRYPFWSFRDGSFPSDRVLTEPLSGCPFINRNHKKIPDDVQVSILSPTEWGSNQKHRDFVTRWLRLACQESLGGNLVRITNSSSQAFSQGTRDEFEPVKPDGRDLIGMWKLAKGVTWSPFPEPDVRPEQSELKNMDSKDQTESTLDVSFDNSESKSAIDDNQPTPEVPVPDSDQTGEWPQDTRLSTQPMPESGDVSFEAGPGPGQERANELSNSSDGTDPSTSAQSVGSFGQLQTVHRPESVDNSSESTKEHASGQLGAEPILNSGRQNSVPASADQSAPDLAEPLNQVANPGGPLNPNEPGNVEAMTNPADASTTGSIRGESSPHPERNLATDEVEKLCQNRRFPEQLRQVLIREAQSEMPRHAVIATWTSDCPHADLNLHMAEVAVRRDEASAPDGTGRDCFEWGICNSLECDSWMNLYHTHRDVRVTVAIIDLQTGAMREYTANLGSVSDHGKDESNRSLSKAWRKIVLNASL